MLKKWFGKKDEEPSKPSAPETQNVGAAEEPTGAPTTEVSADDKSDEAPKSRWGRFTAGLAKTRKSLRTLFSFRRALDDDSLDEIEAELYATDFGPGVVDFLVNSDDGIRAAWKRGEIKEPSELRDHLKKLLRGLLETRDTNLLTAPTSPSVILVAGVNGTGKTTSIAKLAQRFHRDGKRVVLAAADTFRAAAVEQLTIWSERIGVEIVTGSPEADPASVAFQGARRALETNADFLIVDTAGRLHTQKGLMRELGKIHGVLGKQIPGAPHEALLVLDATTGQNALTQARLFGEQIQVTGIVLTKLDGTAKGGIVVAINNELDIPVKYVGLGEGVDDLAPFDLDRFVDALFESEPTTA